MNSEADRGVGTVGMGDTHVDTAHREGMWGTVDDSHDRQGVEDVEDVLATEQGSKVLDWDAHMAVA
jgi:hypothetical protein